MSEALDFAWFPVAGAGDLVERHIFAGELHNVELALWRDDDASICILPNFPYAQRYLALTDIWRTLFEIGQFKPQVLANHSLDNTQTAVHNQLLHIELALNAGDIVQHFNLHSTLVFTKNADGWRVALFHASVALDNNKLADEMPKLLH